MRKTFKAGVAALMLTGALGAGSYALAADKAASMTPEQIQANHVRMCTDRSARTVGHLAYLEAKLKPTAAQQAAWTKYRDAVTADTKVAEQNCLSLPVRSKTEARPTIVERRAMMQKMLEARLTSLRATTPALEGLYASLNADQKAVLDREGGEARHRFERRRDGDRRGGMQDRMGHHGDEAAPAR